MNETPRAASFADQADRSRELALGHAQQAAAMSRAIAQIRDSMALMMSTFGIEHEWVGTALRIKGPDGVWRDGPDLRGSQGWNVELRRLSGSVQWRVASSEDATWGDLIALEEISAQNVEFQASETHLQWRLVGDGAWTDLIPLEEIAGASIEMGVGSGYIRWRVVGAADWINLVSLASITGPSVEIQTGSGYVQWRVVGAEDWINLVALADLAPDVELQKSATHIQWRPIGASTWINLVALADITGPSGAGSGDMVGPESSVTGNFLAFGSTSGKAAVDSGKGAGSFASAAQGTKADNAVPSSYLDTDPTLSANSDLKVATQKAIKAYADGLIETANALQYKGEINASSNPNYPAANAGHWYFVINPGKVGGASGVDVEVGDTLMCKTDGTAAGTHASVGSNWSVVQANLINALRASDIGSTVFTQRTLTGTTDEIDVTNGSGVSGNPVFALAAKAKAAGKQAIPIVAGAMISRTTNGAALNTAEMTTNKNMFVTLDFDTSTQEFAQFTIPMPKSWNESTVTFIPIWSHASTTTNFGVVWQLQGVAISDNEAGDAAFGTAQIVADTGGTANRVYIGSESPAITIAGSPSTSDLVNFQIARVPANGSDTMAVDARLIGVVLIITTDAGNDA